MNTDGFTIVKIKLEVLHVLIRSVRSLIGIKYSIIMNTGKYNTDNYGLIQYIPMKGDVV